MVELVVGILGFAGVIFAQVMQSRKQTIVLEEQIKHLRSEVNSRIESLEDKVDLKIDNLASDVQRHNSVIDRTYQLEREVAVLQAMA